MALCSHVHCQTMRSCAPCDYGRQVPKLLGLLGSEWAPGVMVVSFKLETDEQILVDKVSSGISSCWT